MEKKIKGVLESCEDGIVSTMYIDENGQLMVPKKLYRLLKKHGNPRDIILSCIEKEIAHCHE